MFRCNAKNVEGSWKRRLEIFPNAFPEITSLPGLMKERRHKIPIVLEQEALFLDEIWSQIPSVGMIIFKVLLRAALVRKGNKR